MTETMTTSHFAIVPRDGFFMKDGRDWFSNASDRGHGLSWPWPSTLLGALRNAWGRGEETERNITFTTQDWRDKTGSIRLGRTVALRRTAGTAWSPAHVTWPVPIDAVWYEDHKHVLALHPEAHERDTLGIDDNLARELLYRPRFSEVAKPMSAPRWWNHEDFVKWIAGEPVPIRKDKLATSTRLQVRVGIRPEESVAEDGALFSHDVVETLDPGGEWAMGVEITMPKGGPLPIVKLGSDSRLARVEPLPDGVFEPPATLLKACEKPIRGLRLFAMSPLCFRGGWLPDGLAVNGTQYSGQLTGHEGRVAFKAEVVLRAAFVGRPVHVSGWDMASDQPKPTSRMVPCGAVYFFERADGQPFVEDDFKTLWLAAIGTRTDEGFGRVVPGIWNPARTER